MKNGKQRYLVLSCILATTLNATIVFAGVRSGSLKAQDRPGFAPHEYFVAFKNGLTRDNLRSIKKAGALIRWQFPEVNAVAIRSEQGLSLQALKRNPDVEYVEQVPMRYKADLSLEQLVPLESNGLYGLVTTHATDAQSRGVTGLNINVGIADTGIDYTHPDIAPNYRGGYDAVSQDNDPWWNGDPEEVHATHVAGTLLAANNPVGVLGVAPQANLYHARVLGPNGGTASDIMAGVRKLVIDFHCKAVNLSLGGRTSSKTEANFYKSMHDTYGALIAAAAGNDGKTRLSYPAGYTQNISVGAVDRNNLHASFSNTGRGIDVSAPGVGVLSSVPIGQGTEASVSVSASSLSAFGLEFAGNTTGITATLVGCGRGQTGEFPPTVAGNIALIQRGSITFADKVTNAMNAGAVAAIIYNNVAGDFQGTLGSAATADGIAWIPAVSVSDTAGSQLSTQVGLQATVVNRVSDWDTWDGTSMATPHVTGTLALIWSVNPALSNTTVENHLKSTCMNLGPAGYDTTFGYGLINASLAAARAGGRL